MFKQECIPVGCIPPAHWPYLVVSTMHTPLRCMPPLPCMPPHHHACPSAMHAPPHHACPPPHIPPTTQAPQNTHPSKRQVLFTSICQQEQLLDGIEEFPCFLTFWATVLFLMVMKWCKILISEFYLKIPPESRLFIWHTRLYDSCTKNPSLS